MAASNNINNYHLLARQFLDATVEKWGTDEEAVEQILKSVRDRGSRDDFETAVFNEIDPREAKKLRVQFPQTNFVSAILSQEMSGSQLVRAQELYEKGEDSYCASRIDYLFEGLAAPLDWSSTGSKLALIAGVAASIGLYLISVPVAAVVGGTLVIGTVIYGGGKFLKNSVEFLAADSEKEVKESLRDLGAAITITAMAAPVLPKAIRAFRRPGFLSSTGLFRVASRGSAQGPSNVTPIRIHPGYRSPLVESAQSMIAREVSVVTSQSGISGASARVYALGNTVAVAEAVPAPVIHLTSVGAIHELPLPTMTLWAITGIAANSTLAIHAILTDSEPPLIDVADPENSKRRQAIVRQLQRLQDQKKRIEERLGYCLIIPGLDHQIEALQNRLKAKQNTYGALGTMAVNGAAGASTILHAIGDYYEVLGMTEKTSEVLHRYNLPSLAADYALETEVETDLQALGVDPRREEVVEEFKKLIRAQRGAFQKDEIAKMHARWEASGGRFRYPPDLALADYLSALRAGAVMVEGGKAIRGDWFGEVDPAVLNKGLHYFQGGRGQVQLMGALAVALGKHDASLSNLSTTLGQMGGNREVLGWKRLPIDWRRGYVILSDADAFQPELSGYLRFAKHYADGDLLKAYSIGSALLNKEEFQHLNWGKQVPLKVLDYEHYVQLLKKGDEAGSFANLAGYLRFATQYANGDMQKAYMIASALLSKEEFQRLDWGKAIMLKTQDYERYAQLLRKGDKAGRLDGLAGYLRFAKQYADGDMQKAYQIASALLNKEEFQHLDWGKIVKLKAQDYERYAQRLREGDEGESFAGLAGYLRFAKQYADGDMQKAYEIASALLSKEEFQGLDWGKAVKLKVQDYENYVQRLREGDEAGSFADLAGYLRFAKQYADGDMQKAHFIASALLSKEEFQSLDWGKQVPLKVQDYESYLQLLRKGDEAGSFVGLTGYLRFTRQYADGDMQKAYMIASALLNKEEFQHLNWGKQVYLNVQDYGPYVQWLKKGLRDGSWKGAGGWLRFYATQNCSPINAWMNASAILNDKFPRLEWPSAREAVKLATENSGEGEAQYFQ